VEEVGQYHTERDDRSVWEVGVGDVGELSISITFINLCNTCIYRTSGLCRCSDQLTWLAPSISSKMWTVSYRICTQNALVSLSSTWPEGGGCFNKTITCASSDKPCIYRFYMIRRIRSTLPTC
jgi:hypothetical protein